MSDSSTLYKLASTLIYVPFPNLQKANTIFTKSKSGSSIYDLYYFKNSSTLLIFERHSISKTLKCGKNIQMRNIYLIFELLVFG